MRPRLALRSRDRARPGSVASRRGASAGLVAIASLASLTTIATLAGCERVERPPVEDTIGPAPVVPEDSVAAPEPTGWVAAAGSVMVVAGPSGQAQVVFPSLVEATGGEVDSASVRGELPAGTRVELLGRAGAIGDAVVTAGATAEDAPTAATDSACTQWPAVRLRATGGSAAASELPAGWSVGFVAGLVDAVPLDSLERLARGDSARLAAAVTRIASTLPNDTAAKFRGLPFLVRSARRFSPAPGVEAVVAEVVRKVNQEATPLEEHILVVAERDSASRPGAFAPVYSERTIGAEDEVVTSEVLAAGRLRSSGGAILVLFRDLYEGGRYALLERVGPRRWLLRWTSVYTGC